jgi:hypothetical protein
MAVMYHKPPPATSKAPGELPDRIPRASELSPFQQGQATVASIKHDADTLVSALEVTLKTTAELDELVGGGLEKTKTKELLLAVYEDLLVQLPAVDIAAANALGLGRMLAVTVIMTDMGDPASLKEQFDHHRLGNAHGWLDDLHVALPPHAADAVAGSLQGWEAWVAKNKGKVESAQKIHAERTLAAQGRLWKSLLCGEKLALDLLRPNDYKDAGNRVSRKFLGLVWGYLWRWWLPLVVFLVLTGTLIWAIVHFASSSAATIVGLVAAAAGSLGVSWKTVSATLGKVMEKAEDPLWDTEVRDAIVVATAWTPDKSSPAPAKPKDTEAPAQPDVPAAGPAES